MRVKTCAARIKAVGDDEVPAEGTEEETNDSGLKAGQFEAIVSVFGNVDAVGDVVQKGAFTKTLEDWKSSGDPIPVIWSHDHSNPDAHIGVVDEAQETDKGLLVKGTVDLDEPYAAKVFRLLKGRRVRKFSFAYDVKDGEENDKGGFDLKELELWEVGPTLIPANDDANLLAAKALARQTGIDLKELLALLKDVKSMDLSALRGSKAGRVLSAKNEGVLKEVGSDLQSALKKLNEVLKSVGSDDSEEGKAVEPASSAKRPEKGNTEEVEDPDPASTGGRPAKDADADLKMMLQLASLENGI